MRLFFLLLFLTGCYRASHNPSARQEVKSVNGPCLIVLGTFQDGGSPHIGCIKDCCKNLFANPDPTRMVVSLGLVDWESKQRWLIEATPDLPRQLRILNDQAGTDNTAPSGIFLTHAHIGHYAGLMLLGKEGMNTSGVPVYVLPRMKDYLEKNGPWSQLVKLNNISLKPIHPEEKIQLTASLSVMPFLVPHRDEFSETAGYLIEGPSKKVLFIPDIDKWEKWGNSIVSLVSTVDHAFIDATFYDGEEIQNRNISEIPHPFVIESMRLFSMLPVAERNKIQFIHFNHTNPLANPTGEARKNIEGEGYRVAAFRSVFPL
jgi:pyrroloquinoline quinone biosynthesis protein B